uniref:Uncharacterized protein n=1 Tax=Oryza meridionalis TaxID=40149 RepID=A0A0E0EJB9_9ORYZ
MPLVRIEAVEEIIRSPSSTLSQLSEDIGKLLKMETRWSRRESFKVGSEAIATHSASGTIVFKAELYRLMRGERGHEITIQGMQPIMYVMDEEMKELIKHLLVTVDRYTVEGLKTMCEDV